MRVRITVKREYEMDEARILAEPSFDPPAPDEAASFIQAWLEESFYELCGFARDRDHIDGSYVHLVDEISDSDFDLTESL